jgi:mannose-6-phosphate isomerase
MWRLENSIQHYAWGSHIAIAKLLGLPVPSPQPDAELWLGAHPKSPSHVLPSHESLTALIEREPERLLGRDVYREYGARLPFLLKVLAAETPLSLQAHPTRAQAAAGFDAEEARGVPLDAAERNYKDRNHKPELLCALTPFSALCGFRSIPQSLELFRALRAPRLSAVCETLEQLPTEAGLSQVFSTLLQASPERRRDLAQETLDRCTELAAWEGPFQREFSWAVRVGVLYPGDIGLVTALLLNLIELAPGEAIFLPAGNLHAYLQGVGIEILANSDNVLRGGLTPKHVDTNELLRVLDFRSGPTSVLRGEARGSARVYQTTAPDFELQTFELFPSERPTITDRRGPEILLCQEGSIDVACGGETERLTRGQSLFIAASEPSYALSGEGTLFRAGVGV